MKLITKKSEYNLLDRTYIMGILNVTPDSFSDGGSYTTIDRAIEQAVRMEKEGADIIDIGGESTRPGHKPLSAREEIERVVPIIKAVSEYISIPISIDTYKAETARAAIEAGADIINDIWGAKKDTAMSEVASETGAPIVLMHNRDDMNYVSLIDDMKNDLQESIEIALRAGVKKEQIILDPGVGFAKTAEHNLIVMNNLDAFQSLGFPILLGTSRKRFIGGVLNIEDAGQRDIGTGATTCLGIAKGVQIVRVHNVSVTDELARMMDAMVRSDREA